MPLLIQEEIPIPGRFTSVERTMDELRVLLLYVPPYVDCASSRAVCSIAGMITFPNTFAMPQLLSVRSPAIRIENPMSYSGISESREL